MTNLFYIFYQLSYSILSVTWCHFSYCLPRRLPASGLFVLCCPGEEDRGICSV